MTSPPAYITAVPPVPAVHTAPPLAYQWQSLSADQQKVLWTNLLESIWQQFTLWVQGILMPGPAGPQIQTWSANILDPVWTDIVNTLSGLSATSWTRSSSQQALTDNATVLASLQATVAALKQNANQGSLGGQSAIVDFSMYANSTNLPSIFTETYSGAGSGTFGVSNGYAQAALGDNTARSASFLYNVFVTDTDYQAVGGVWRGAPVNDGFGHRGYISLDARKNAAGTTKVQARFASDSVELCCFNAGTKTSFAILGNGGSGFFNFKTGAVYFLLAGTVGGLRVFVVTENGTPILTYTDVSTSQVGSLYRGTGGTAEWPTSVGNVNPGAQLYWAAQDNTPAATVGSYARVYRATAVATGTLTGFGDAQFPASTFDTPDRITPDITHDAATNKFTVSKSGTYIFEFDFSGNFSVVVNEPVEMLCWKGSGGGSPAVYARKSHGYWDNSSWARFGATFTVYLAAGDWVQPGHNFPLTSLSMSGEATGTVTWMSLAEANP